MIFPNGYNQFFKSVSDVWIPLVGSVAITSLYTVFAITLVSEHLKI